MMGGEGKKNKLKMAAWKLFHTCGFGVHQSPPSSPPTTTLQVIDNNNNNNNNNHNHNNINITDPTTSSSKSMCAICLEPLNYTTPTQQPIFTAQCSHSFHFDCIASNVRHGGVTCPICRAQWTHLPRPPTFLYANQTDDPILRILDDSIATFRVHRRSILRSARYDDDDPIEPPTHTAPDRPRLHLSILSPPHTLRVTLAHQTAIDLVLVASPNGPHLRLIKQSMALVVFSLRPIDRLAVVTYSSAAARVFPLRRMTSYGKRAALQVIDRLFYMGQADPVEGLKKGVKVLIERAYENPQSCILHLSDNPTRSYHTGFDAQLPIQIHRFHVGHSFGTTNGFVMHEFEEFLGRILGDKITDIKLRIREDGRIVRLAELRSGEERRIPLNISESEDGNVCVEYSYVEHGVRECMRTGELTVGSVEKQREADTDGSGLGLGTEDGRSSNAGSWDYHDPFMARRWAKHLHGYRL